MKFHRQALLPLLLCGAMAPLFAQPAPVTVEPGPFQEAPDFLNIPDDADRLGPVPMDERRPTDPEVDALTQPVYPEAGPLSPRGPIIDPEARPQRREQPLPGDVYERRIKYRQVLVRARNEPAVQEAWDRAQDVRTDEEQRTALREYYTMLFSRMRQIEPSLKGRIDANEQARLATLVPVRTEPLRPAPVQTVTTSPATAVAGGERTLTRDEIELQSAFEQDGQ